MSALLLRPLADAVADGDEVRFGEHGVIAVCDAADGLAFVLGLAAFVDAAVVGGEGVGEGGAGVREERWWERSRGAFGEERVSCY